jgi:hypothetical protein
MEKVIKFLSWFYPLLFALLMLWLSIEFNFSYKVKNFDKVLDGSITFSSIVVGFLGALLGILVSIKDSNIVKAIFETKEKYTLRLYFNETFIIGFAVVILSCTMHVIREYPSLWTNRIFYFWIIAVTWFLPSTYRIVSILMAVFFKTNNARADERPKGNKIMDEQQREEMKRKLSK